MRPGLASKTPAPKGSCCTGFIFISLTHLHRVVTDGLACLPVHSKPIINRGQLTPRDTWSLLNTGGLFIPQQPTGPGAMGRVLLAGCPPRRAQSKRVNQDRSGAPEGFLAN